VTDQYLYRVQPTRPGFLIESTPEEDGIVGDHFRYLESLAQRDTVLLAGRTLNTDETSFGIVVFVAESEDDARRIVDADPAVRAGVFRADLFPYRIALTGGELAERGSTPSEAIDEA